MELWAQLKNEDWSYVTGWVNWPLRLWDFTKHYQYIGRAGAEGVGYYAPASRWRGARQQEARPYQRVDSTRRRFDGRAGRAVDGGEVSGSAPDRHAEQPRVSPRSHVVPARGAACAIAASSSTQEGFGLGNPNIDFAKMARKHGCRLVGTDLRSEGSRRRDSPRHRRREARRAVSDRRRDATALDGLRVKKLLLASALLCCASSAMAQAARTDRAAVANGESVYLRIGLPSLPWHRRPRRSRSALGPEHVAAAGVRDVGAQRHAGLDHRERNAGFPGDRHFGPRASRHPHVSREPAAAPGGRRYPAAGALEAPIRAVNSWNPACRSVPTTGKASNNHAATSRAGHLKRKIEHQPDEPLQPEWYAAIDIIPIGPDESTPMLSAIFATKLPLARPSLTKRSQLLTRLSTRRALAM